MVVIRQLGNAVGAAPPGEVLEDQYAVLREKCIENFGEDNCNAWLPRNMVYAVTRREEGQMLPWWGWMIAGYVLSKIVRI
jgi:uncharacterized protein YgiB involved in biofilm formation